MQFSKSLRSLLLISALYLPLYSVTVPQAKYARLLQHTQPPKHKNWYTNIQSLLGISAVALVTIIIGGTFGAKQWRKKTTVHKVSNPISIEQQVAHIPGKIEQTFSHEKLAELQNTTDPALLPYLNQAFADRITAINNLRNATWNKIGQLRNLHDYDTLINDTISSKIIEGDRNLSTWYEDMQSLRKRNPQQLEQLLQSSGQQGNDSWKIRVNSFRGSDYGNL